MNTSLNKFEFRAWNDMFGQGVIALLDGQEVGYCANGYDHANTPAFWIPSMELAPLEGANLKAWQNKIASEFQKQIPVRA